MEETIGKNYLIESEISGLQKKCCIDRFLIYMQGCVVMVGMEKERKLLGISIALTVLFCILLVVTVCLNQKIQGISLDYEIREVTVDTADRVRNNVLEPNKPRYSNHVVVSYQGEQYELINVKDGELSGYQAAKTYNQTIEVLFYDGKMYANADGIKTDNQTANFYFLMLGVDFFVFLAAALVIGAYVDCRRAGGSSRVFH